MADTVRELADSLATALAAAGTDTAAARDCLRAHCRSLEPLRAAAEQVHVREFWIAAVWWGAHHAHQLSPDALIQHYGFADDREIASCVPIAALLDIYRRWGPDALTQIRACAPLPSIPAYTFLDVLRKIARFGHPLAELLQNLPPLLASRLQKRRQPTRPVFINEKGRPLLLKSDLDAYYKQYLETPFLHEAPASRERMPRKAKEGPTPSEPAGDSHKRRRVTGAGQDNPDPAVLRGRGTERGAEGSPEAARTAQGTRTSRMESPPTPASHRRHSESPLSEPQRGHSIDLLLGNGIDIQDDDGGPENTPDDTFAALETRTRTHVAEDHTMRRKRTRSSSSDRFLHDQQLLRAREDYRKSQETSGKDAANWLIRSCATRSALKADCDRCDAEYASAVLAVKNAEAALAALILPGEPDFESALSLAEHAIRQVDEMERDVQAMLVAKEDMLARLAANGMANAADIQVTLHTATIAETKRVRMKRLSDLGTQREDLLRSEEDKIRKGEARETAIDVYEWHKKDMGPVYNLFRTIGQGLDHEDLAKLLSKVYNG